MRNKMVYESPLLEDFYELSLRFNLVSDGFRSDIGNYSVDNLFLVVCLITQAKRNLAKEANLFELQNRKVIVG